jgi:hypothetical protein
VRREIAEVLERWAYVLAGVEDQENRIVPLRENA